MLNICAGECKSKARLDGKTAVVTGGNTGIGLETAKDLAKRGARVIIACRDQEKAKKAAEEIKKETEVEVFTAALDLASFDSIRAFAKELLKNENHINILVNNAGIMMCPESKTKDGFETQFGVNHLGHFLLTNLLLDRIKESAPARIVTLSSSGHTYGKMNWDDLNSTKDYSPTNAYAQSKLANILFIKELAKKLKDTGVTTYAVHPGVVNTELFSSSSVINAMPDVLVKGIKCLFFKDVKSGAQTSIYCAVDEHAEKETGLYYAECKVHKPSKLALVEPDAVKLWEVSLKMVGLPEEK